MAYSGSSTELVILTCTELLGFAVVTTVTIGFKVSFHLRSDNFLNHLVLVVAVHSSIGEASLQVFQLEVLHLSCELLLFEILVTS